MPPSLMDKFAVASALWASTALATLTIAIDGREALAGSVTYTYDASGRLTTATYDTGVVITYSYDSNGNRSQSVATVPAPPLSSPPPPSSPPTSPPVVGVTIASNTSNLNLWNYLVANNFATSGKSGTWEVLIENGVAIGSTSTGAPAFDTGSFPSGSTLSITNNGTIEGAGGAGGGGGHGACAAGGAGSAGGAAFRAQLALTLTNNGAIEGGGGGGGGGGTTNGTGAGAPIGTGGGGGAGNVTGSGGGGGYLCGGGYCYSGAGGYAGTATSGGAGGPLRVLGNYTGGAAGGPGGSPGQAGYAGSNAPGAYGVSCSGGAGGGAGAALIGSANVTFAARGTLKGPSQ
jgi:YD repeat-containing protein